jgi:hypothetical protein
MILTINVCQGTNFLTTQNNLFQCVNNKYCLRPQEDIVNFARHRLNESRYHVITRNCQHFANECRYGINTSQEVNRTINRTTELVSYVASGIIAFMIVDRLRN